MKTVGLQNQISEFESQSPRHKICPVCGIDKPLTFFNKKGKNRLQSLCRLCSRTSSRVHYENNKKIYRDRNRRRIEEIKNFVDSFKSRPCCDCGQSFPSYVMDFDHLEDKKFYISRAPRIGFSIENVIKEIQKCDVVCANCHRIRTYKRRVTPL